MRILWFVPVFLPEMKDVIGLSVQDGGGWIESLYYELKRQANHELGVACFSKNLKKDISFIKNGTHFYCMAENKTSNQRIDHLMNLFNYKAKVNLVLKKSLDIIKDFGPDVIHVHGTERPFGLLSGVTKVPVLISIQGVLSACKNQFWGQLPLFDYIKYPNLVYSYLYMKKRAETELRIFTTSKYFSGRTEWDKMWVKKLNPDGNYFKVGEIIRPEFYQYTWEINNINKYQLFSIASALPYKGIDLLIDAIYILQNKFPKIKLHLGGDIPLDGYGGFIRRKIEKYNLIDKIEFFGWMNEKQLVRELISAHVFVLPSFIENSSNSLAEAQLIGVPTIAAEVGGIPSMIENEVSGLLFSAGDKIDLAKKIQRFFEDSDLTIRCSKDSKLVANIRHNKEYVVQDLVHSYKMLR